MQSWLNSLIGHDSKLRVEEVGRVVGRCLGLKGLWLVVDYLPSWPGVV